MGADGIVPIRLRMGSHVHPSTQGWQEEEIGSKSLPPHTAQTRPVFQATLWLVLFRCCLSSTHVSIAFFFHCGEINICGFITYVCPLTRKFNFPVIIPTSVSRMCRYVFLHNCIRYPNYVVGKKDVRICVRRVKVGNMGQGWGLALRKRSA